MISMVNVNALRNIKRTRMMRIGLFQISKNFGAFNSDFSFFFKCDRRGSCAGSPTFDENGQPIELNASKNCQGKICRHKCRCEYRFTHTYAELHVYRQITHFWDGGTDYYTGCNLKKYTKKQSIERRFTAYQSRMNTRRSASVLLAVKKFKQTYSA